MIRSRNWSWNKSIAVFCIFVLSVIFALYVYLISCAAGNWAGRPEIPGTAFSRMIKTLLGSLDLRYDVFYGLSSAGVREDLLFAVSFSLSFFGGIWYVLKDRLPALFVYRKRWLLAALLVLAVVASDLNGTSLYCWKNTLGLPDEAAPVWGVPRWIRFDEYHIWTPMALSQSMAGFPAYNPYIAGGGTDATWISMGGLPAWNAALIFKPLYWGFFVFGASRGTAFLWITRSVLLFLVSFTCAMRYTGERKHLSFLAGVLFTFAPYVQWWYSQSIAEIFLFGQTIILCVHSYITSDSLKKRWLLSGLLAYSFGCLIMVGYPSWFIPVLYLSAVLTAGMVFCGRQRLEGRDLIRFLIPLLTAVAWLLVIVWFSRDTLQAIRSSSYPGARVYTGGHFSKRYFSGLYTLLFPLMDPPSGDPSSESCFLSFFPAGMIISCYSMWKEKKRDPLCVTLICFEFLIFLFQYFGVSGEFAKLTLLSQCTRMEAFLGSTDIVLLLRALSRKQIMPAYIGIPAATICSAACTLLTVYCFHPQKGIIVLLLAGNLFAFLTLMTCRIDEGVSKRFLTYSLSMILVLAGCFVNPIQRGTGFLTDSAFVERLRELPDDQGLYLMESDDFTGEALVLAQKRSFNTMQVYADPGRWKPVDPNGKYYDIYNQLCNVSVSLTEEPTTVESLGKAMIRAHLNYNDLEKLGINYVLSRSDYRMDEKVSNLEHMDTINDWHVYRVS